MLFLTRFRYCISLQQDAILMKKIFSNEKTKIAIIKSCKMKQLLLLFLLLSIIKNSSAQNVGIGTNAPHTSAVLDITSADKGMLVPRITTLQRNAIALPATGLLVFDTNTNSFWYYSGTVWMEIVTNTTAWLAKGNGSIDTATHFLGTINNMPLRFKLNNVWAGQWDAVKENYFIGNNAGIFNISGTLNVAVGSGALQYSKTAFGTTAIGYQALRFDTSGSGQTAVGCQALRNNRFGKYNTAIGFAALESNGSGTLVNPFDGHSNTAVGIYTLNKNTLGYLNTVTGADAMTNNTTGFLNTAVGNATLLNNTSGGLNTAFGSFALQTNNGFSNTACGVYALSNTTFGSSNVAVGGYAGNTNLGGSRNTFLGENSDAASNALQNTTAIGHRAYVSQSNSLILGSIAGTNDATDDTRVGIGTTAPVDKLHISNGNARIEGDVLTTGSIGIGTTSPNSKSVLDMVSTTKGILLPRMSTSQRLAISAPPNGLLVYDFDKDELHHYDGGNWRAVLNSRYWNRPITSRSIIANSVDSVGIGTSLPAARLDVNDNFKLGNNGTVLAEIIKSTETYDIPSLAPGAVDIQTFVVPNVTFGSAVSISPSFPLPDGITISYARISAAGIVEVKVVNAGTVTQNPTNMSFTLIIMR
jgi:hypothetical protein